MPDDWFFDTNILIYAVVPADPRSVIATGLLTQGGRISVQVLNEFANVARRKLQRPWTEVATALAAVRVLCPAPVPISLATHESALAIAQRYGFSLYDALIVAAALEAECSTLFSEDLQHGQLIEGTLRVQNPFIA